MSSLRETMQQLSTCVTTAVMSPDGNFLGPRRGGHAGDRSGQVIRPVRQATTDLKPMSRSEQSSLLHTDYHFRMF